MDRSSSRPSPFALLPHASSCRHGLAYLTQRHAALARGDALGEVHGDFFRLTIHRERDEGLHGLGGLGKSLLQDDEVSPHLGQWHVLRSEVENHADLGRVGWT